MSGDDPVVNRSIVAALLAVAVAVPFGEAVAHADPADDQFVAALNAANVPGNSGAEIGIAHESCGLLNVSRVGRRGPPPFNAALIKVRNELLDQGVEPGTQIRTFEHASSRRVLSQH
jgi:hypothetical protein